MKKSNWHNSNINRNNNTVGDSRDANHHIASHGPIIQGSNFFGDQYWLGEEEMVSGVQIIEIKSTEDSESSTEKDKEKHNPNDPFYFSDPSINNIRCEPPANVSAREKRRIKSQLAQSRNVYEENKIVVDEYDTAYDNEHFYRDYYVSGSKNSNFVGNNPINCFTIFDKQYMGTSEYSSEEDMPNIEVIDCIDSNPEAPWNQNAEIVPYDMEADSEKRMVWIYSFKNKRLLPDEFDVFDGPQEPSISSSFPEEGADFHGKNSHRIATPIPSAFVPRLNLSMSHTLPTVTEVTEPPEHKSSSSDDHHNNVIRQKPRNNWFFSQAATPTDEHNNTNNIQKSSNVVEWMSLSPRERRRLQTCALPNPEFACIREMKSTAENMILDNATSSRQTAVMNGTDRSHKSAAVETESKMNSPPSKQESIVDSTRTYKSNSSIKDYQKSITPMTSSRTAKTKRLNFSKMTTIEIIDDQNDAPNDRGDYVKPLKASKIPRIRIAPKPRSGCTVSDPLEKLESDNWIVETSANTNTRYEKEIQPSERGDDGGIGNVIFMKHMSLFKPAEWEAYLPITESVPSLSLTNTNSENYRRSWLIRLCTFFRCCK